MKRYFFNVILMLDKLRIIIHSFQYSYFFDFKLIMEATFLQRCFSSFFNTNHICEETLKSLETCVLFEFSSILVDSPHFLRILSMLKANYNELSNFEL